MASSSRSGAVSATLLLALLAGAPVPCFAQAPPAPPAAPEEKPDFQPFAEVSKANDIFIGVNALDYSGYPDCRPEYIEAFTAMANLATKAGVEGADRLTIHTPLIRLTKAQIIQQGLALGVDFALTSSCYDPAADGVACGRCDSCSLRLKGFREAGQTVGSQGHSS